MCFYIKLGHVMRFLIIFSLLFSIKASTDNQVKLELISKIKSSSSPSVKDLGELFSLSFKEANELLRFKNIELVAVGLIKIKKYDIYNKKVKNNLKDVGLFEDEISDSCKNCKSLGTVDKTCKKCRGAKGCTNSQCRSGRTRTQSVSGATRYLTCGICRGSGKCKSCLGKGTLNSRCTTCNGLGKKISVSKINQKLVSISDELITLYNNYHTEGLQLSLNKSVVIIEAINMNNVSFGSGTGFYCNFSGSEYIISNAHVCFGGSKLKITSPTFGKLEYDKIYYSKERDLALIKLKNDSKMPVLNIHPTVTSLTHKKILVLGNSGGEGVITSIKGEVKGVGHNEIEIDAEIIGGNSGGPIFYEDRVVGVSTRAVLRSSTWITKGTQFDKVRRFGTRIDNLKFSDFELVNKSLEGSEKVALDFYESLKLGILNRVDTNSFRGLTKMEKDILTTFSKTDQIKRSSSYAFRMFSQASIEAKMILNHSVR